MVLSPTNCQSPPSSVPSAMGSLWVGVCVPVVGPQVLDEVHERSTDADLLLLLAKLMMRLHPHPGGGGRSRRRGVART